MGLFARWSPRSRPPRMALGRPGLDGGGWPDEAEVGRPSFEANTYHELAVRNAYASGAHALAEELVDAAMPHLPIAVDPQDEPYLRKLVTVAARVGVGIAMVERTVEPTPDRQAGETVDRHVAAALWQARRKQPAMPPHLAAVAAWFLLAGFWVERTERAMIPELVDGLTSRGG